LNKKTDKKKDKSHINQYAKYSGLAFQLFLALLIAAYIGQFLDKKLALPNSYITLLLIIIVFFGFMYKIVKELS
jgi:preprotein translocase subunit SecY